MYFPRVIQSTNVDGAGFMSHPKLEYLRRFVKENDPKEEYKVLSAIGSGTYGDVFKVSAMA